MYFSSEMISSLGPHDPTLDSNSILILQFLISKIGCQNQSNFRSDARNKAASRADHSGPTRFISVLSESSASAAINATQAKDHVINIMSEARHVLGHDDV